MRVTQAIVEWRLLGSQGGDRIYPSGWRYKSTGHAPDHQLRAVLPGADPGAPQEMVATVWDADEQWTVVWYEDGERRGRMSRRIGYDPISLRIHPGDELPPRRTWVDPYPRYLYYAPVSTEAREVIVEAADRFGRTYSAVAGPLPAGMDAWPLETSSAGG